MATLLDPKQLIPFEEPFLSQIARQEAPTKLLIENGIFTKEEFLDMVKVVNAEVKKEGSRNARQRCNDN